MDLTAQWLNLHWFARDGILQHGWVDRSATSGRSKQLLNYVVIKGHTARSGDLAGLFHDPSDHVDMFRGRHYLVSVQARQGGNRVESAVPNLLRPLLPQDVVRGSETCIQAGEVF